MTGPYVDGVRAATNAIIERSRLIFVQTTEDGGDERLEMIENRRFPTDRRPERNDQRLRAVPRDPIRFFVLDPAVGEQTLNRSLQGRDLGLRPLRDFL